MNININHPSFILFLDTITKNILSHIPTDNYFSLPIDQKMGIQSMVFNLMKNSLKFNTTLNDAEFKAFIVILCAKNEELENYEFSGILKDIVHNYELIIDSSKKPKKTTKTEKKNIQ